LVDDQRMWLRGCHPHGRVINKMTTWTNTTKNASSFTNQTKNSATFTNQTKTLSDLFLLIDDTFALLIDNTYKTVIDTCATPWANQTKN
jgi:hypothetical protein